MCGRYVLFEDNMEKLSARFDAENQLEKWEPSYNIAPTTLNPVVTSHSPNKIQLMKWGLIPKWAKEEKIGYKMINARSETAAEKPSFREAFKFRRCLIPANGFYEWKRNGKEKTPYYIHSTKHKLFAFAGLYEIWNNPNGSVIQSYTILTQAAVGKIKDIHDRMPIILEQEEETEWLNADSTEPAQLQKLFNTYPDENIDMHTISNDVNSPAHNSSELIVKT
jgi:putative SOS response-associated peptidase YedK